jgi:hypothetical protein
MSMTGMDPAFPIACPLCGAGVLNGEQHRAWHAGQGMQVGEVDADGGVALGELIVGWLDEIDPQAVEQLVLAAEPTMTDSPIAGTIAVLRQLAAGA